MSYQSAGNELHRQLSLILWGIASSLTKSPSWGMTTPSFLIYTSNVPLVVRP